MPKHVHAECIKAWADGAKIQYYYNYRSEWQDIVGAPSWDAKGKYRIKPEPKPDREYLCKIDLVAPYTPQIYSSVHVDFPCPNSRTWDINAKLVFDGETGQLKAVELIK